MESAAYLKSHFSVSQPKALRSRTRGYLSELRQAMCPEESHSPFCSPFSPAEFLAAASDLSLSTVTGPDKVAYSLLKHLPSSGMDFLSHLHCYLVSALLPSGRHLPLFPFTKWESLSTLLLHSGLSLSPSASQSFLNASFYRAYSFFWSLILFSLSLHQTGFRPGQSTLYQILFLAQSISDEFNKHRLGSRMILATIDFLKAFDSVWHPALFRKLILAGLAPLLVGLNLTLLIGVLA